MSLWELADLSTPWSLHVAVTLRVAEHLNSGHTEIADLAAAAGAHPESLHRVLRHLVSKGVFLEPSPGHFELNDPARQLLSPGARVGLDLDGFGGRMANSWASLLSAVRTGRPAYHEVFGLPFWDDLAAHPHIHAQFDDLMGPGHGTPDWRILPDPNSWSSLKTVVDVGGNRGYLLAEILRAQPHLRGILVDLPDTVAASRPVFESAGVQDRVATSPQSFFDPLPPAADLYILSKVLGDWPDTEARAILTRCAEAARPSNGSIIVPISEKPGQPASPELLMLVLVGGKGRTVEQLTALAAEAGLTLHATGAHPSGKTLLEFKPV